MALHSSRTRRLQEAKGIDQHQVTMKFIRRHSPCENERSRVRSVDGIAIKLRGDINRKQIVSVDHVIDLGAKLARNLEQVALELLVDLRTDTGCCRREWLFGVLDTPACASGG